MNANRLLSHFEQIGDAPDAVDRLRRFIVDLAVRGKLVEQDPREGTATDLLAQHRVAVEASGEMQPFSLPESWAWVPVGVVCSKTGSGSTPRGGKTAYVSKGIPFLRSQNVHDDGLTLDDVAYIDAATHSKMIGTAVQPEDLLLNITGGSMGRCCHVPCSFKEGNVSQHVAILRAAIPGTQAFLHKCIISPFFQRLIFDEQTGAGRGGLPKNRMDRLPIPLPPLAEQHRIVEKVDELMMLCDRLEASQAEREGRRDRLVVASLNRLSQPSDPDEFKKDARFQLSHLSRLSTKPEHIKEIRKAILNLAVRGTLVPQDEAWHTAPLSDVAEQIVDCPHSTPKWQATGKVCVRTNQFSPGRLDLTASRFVSEATYRERIQRLKPKANDILYSREGGILGVACRVPVDVELCLGQRMMLIRPGPKAVSEYLELVLNSPLITEIARKSTTGGAAPRVNVSTVTAYPIPLPSLAEQKRIVAKVDELMAICDQLERQIESQQKDSRQLLEALLHEALEGVG